MRESAEPNSFRHSPLRRVAVLGLLFVAAVISCGKDVTGPLGAAGRYVRGLAFNPIFPPAFQAAGGTSSGVVDFTSVHVVLHHSDGTVALDTTINFPAGQDSLTVDLTVRLLDNAPTTGEPMSLDLGYLNAAGVVVFQGGPVSITAAPPSAPGTPNPPVKVPVTYTGPGASAVAVSISPRTQTVVAGSPFSFSAVAKDASGATLASTPVIWNSADPSIASISSPAAGSGIAQNQRGTARIIAQLFSGASDTVLVSVTLPASQIIAQSGNAQTGVVGANLTNPLIVKVAASDGVGVAGTTVTFAVATGGGSVGSATAISDANGLAQTTFKLGAATGAQTVTASAGSLNNSPITFTATAQAATATKLVVTTGPVSGVAGTALAPIVFTAQDNNGNVATTFTGAVTIAFGTNTAGATLGGSATVNAVAGVATFSGLTINKNGTAYTLVASSTGITSATTGTFDIAVGAPSKLVFSVQPSSAVANAGIAPAMVVNAQDSQGNPTPSFTGAVTLAFANNPTSATLGGTLSVNAVAGAATFSGITVTTAGSAYTLAASATGLTAATSTAFDISAAGGGGATQLKFTVQPAASTVAGVSISPSIVVQARDAGNALVPTFVGNVTLTIAANPGASTLGGTVTVAAVGGSATFNNITLNHSGVGYTLSAASGVLTPDVSTAFTITAGAAANLAISGGQAQSGPTASPLATSLQVTVTDANGNNVSGTTVNWATPSGGSMSPASSVTNAAGVAATAWTLGPSAGPQTATATSGTLAGSPATFSATATSTFASRTWTGAINNSWTNAGNWSPAIAPLAGDSVSIPVVATFPTISADTAVSSLTIASGAHLTLSSGAVTLTVHGALDATGAIVGGGNVALTPSPVVARLLRGVIGGAVTINGTYGMNGPLTVTGNVAVGTNGAVVFNNNPFTVNGNFSTTSTGGLNMGNPSDVLSVFGNATFSGGNGSITNGTINVTGNFVQSVSAASFSPSGANTVVFSGTVSQSIVFSNTGASHFQNVQVTNAAGVAMATNGVIMNGNVVIGVGGISGAGMTLNIGGTLTDPSGLLTTTAVSFSGSTAPISSTTHTLHPNVTFANNPSVLAGDVLFLGNVGVTGNLQINGHKAGVAGGFSTTAAGQLTMTNSADSLGVGGAALFSGGVEAGILTAGKLVLNGNFSQMNGGSGQEFKASVGHLTMLVGTGAQTISFTDPDVTATTCSLSCFGDFTIAKSSGTVDFNSPAGANGAVNVNAGVTAVTSTNFLLVRGATTTASGTNVHVSRFGTFGAINFAADSSTIADTIQFHGNASQTIPLAEYNEVVIKGTPTLSAGGFIADGNLTVDGGTLTLGGQAVSVYGGFLTTNAGTVVMTNALDSLLVVGQATFSGGAESGKLTNGTLVLFQGIAVSAAGQFSASGSHTTVLVGPTSGGCDCPNLIPAHSGTISASASRSSARIHTLSKALAKALLDARRAKSAAFAKAARAQLAAVKTARKALASKWIPSATALQMAAAAGKNARLPHAIQPRALVANKSRSLADVRFSGPQIAAPRKPIGAGGTHRASSILVQSYSDSAVYVAFATASGNQFGNVRIVGDAQVTLLATAAGNVQMDTTSDLSGNGHLTVQGNLTGSVNSTLELEGLELFGVLADSGTFEPDTTVFSGASQMMPSQVGPINNIDYTNVVVNSPALGVPAEDDAEIDIYGSLFIQNSGVLRIGLPIGSCNSCDSDELYVYGALETHGSGALQMTDNNYPFLTVSDSAWFAGGSTTGLLTQGEIDFYGNFRQAGSTTAYAAVSPHFSYLGSASPQYVTFANSGAATSHFGDFYLGGPTAVFMSNVYANGSFQTGHVISHTAQAGTAGVSLTSLGADVRDLEFDGVTWTLLDGYDVTDMDVVEFANENPAATQFTMSRSGAFALASLTGWIFDVTPTSGKYMNVTDIDGATSGVLTVNMSGTSPGSPGSFTTTSGGAVINGWSNFASAMWLGLSSNWNDGPNNWSTGVVPDVNTNVTISCDCSSPTTPGVVAIHDLTITNGNQLSLGGALTVNGNLSIQSGSDIAATYNVVALGNVTADPTSSTAAIFCNTGTTGLILAGSSAQNVTGKFCRVNVLSTTVASGRIYAKNTTNYASALTIQSGGSLDLNGHSVETDSMSTIGTGTFTMTHALDSLIIHGASGNFAANFSGGSETGLITNGTIVLRSPNFHANGTSFDATFNNVVIADTTGGQTFRWTGATVGHGFNNLILKNSNFDNFATTDLVVQGTLTLDASMGTSGQFAGTGASLYAGSLVDNTGNATGGFAGAYWIHLTQSGAAPAKLPVDSLFFEYGGNMQLANNVTTSAVVIVRPDVLTSSNTGLYLNGHTLKTTNKDFVTTGTAFLVMQSAGDSLDVGTANVFFNGGDGFTSALTKGGISAGGFYQGYMNTTTLASGAAASSYNPSGTHRIWLTDNAKVIFANPGTGSTASHFNSLHSGGKDNFYSDIFVDDTLYLATSGLQFASDQPNTTHTRVLTTKGLGNNTISNGVTFNNVTLKFVDGQPAPTDFSNVQWTGFPLFGANVFEIARTSGSPITNLTNHDFSPVGILGLSLGGHLVSNTGTVNGWSFTSVNAGLLSLLTSFTLNAGNVFP